MTNVEIQIEDHGIEHEQYFQGAGVMFSKFEHIATGAGENFKEAVDDALETIAQEVDSATFQVIELAVYNDSDYLGGNQDEQVPEDAEDCHYYVSIKYSYEADKPHTIN